MTHHPMAWLHLDLSQVAHSQYLVVDAQRQVKHPVQRDGEVKCFGTYGLPPSSDSLECSHQRSVTN
jgi:hypothetical protein